jgi:hypothetical protein
VCVAPWHCWGDNIKIDFLEKESEITNWNISDSTKFQWFIFMHMVMKYRNSDRL